MTPLGTLRPRYRWAVAAYDRVYQFLHHLDRPGAEIGPAIRLEVRRSRWTLTLVDGTVVRRGELIGVLHLNNPRIAHLHSDGLAPIGVGLEFRRQAFASFRELAKLAAPGGRLADVRAFSATTILHRGLSKIGFQPEAGGMTWPWLVAAYQRTLLASLHPAGRERFRRSAFLYSSARRMWISRETLLRLYGPDRKAS